MIKAENLSISFGSRVLFSSVSFTIGKGIFQFKGDSGKGKTTLRNILRKQQIPDSGKISYSEDNPLFSYCGPKSTLLSEYSLEKNRKILKKPLDQNRFDEIRKGLGFHYLEKNLLQLSGGERRKAELLLCLSYDADYYFLDEPFASLDKETKDFLTGYLNEFGKEHPIILISHEVNPNLVLSGSLDLNHTEQIKQTKEKKVLQRKGTFHLLPAFLDDQKSNRRSNFICGLLGILSFIAFAFGVAFTQTKSTTDKTRIARQADPFSAHYFNPFSIPTLPEDNEFYEILEDKGITKLNLHSRKNGGTLSLFGCLADSEPSFYFYSHGQSKPRIKEAKNVTINGTDYPVKVIDKGQLSSLNLPDSIERKKLLDDKIDGEYLFCSNSFINCVISCQAKGLVFSSDSFYPLNAIVYDSLYDSLKTESSERANCVIEDKEQRLLAVPGKKKGDTVSISQKKECIVNAEYDDNIVHLSSTRYKILYLMKDLNENDISLLVKDKDFSSLAKFSSELRGKDLIYSVDFGIYPILCYIIAAAFFVGEVLYCFVSYTGAKRWRNSLYHLYQNNGFSSSSFRIGLLLSKIVNFLPSLLLSFLFYFLGCLPLANHKEMTRVYDKRRNGLYYYSQQPRNNYYDSIRHPVSFETALPYIYLLFVLVIAFVLVQWSFLVFSGKEKSKK